MLNFGQEKQIGNFTYNLGALIGEGFSARVYRGTNHFDLGTSLLTGQPVAVKVVELRQLDSQVEGLLLRNEINCHKIMKHENIVVLLDQLQSRDRLYIVSELCEGGNLYDYIIRQGNRFIDAGRFNEDLAMRTLFQITKAVNYIHSKGVIHRDIKSGNVLLKAGFQVKLADFGFADFRKPNNQPEKFNVGSPVYMSPEAYLYSQYSEKSDVWAIGMILYEMLVGDQPFADSTFERVLQSICSGKMIATLPNSVTPFCRFLLERMFQIDPSSRADTGEILSYLRDYLINGDNTGTGSRTRYSQNTSFTLIQGR